METDRSSSPLKNPRLRRGELDANVFHDLKRGFLKPIQLLFAEELNPMIGPNGLDGRAFDGHAATPPLVVDSGPVDQ